MFRKIACLTVFIFFVLTSLCFAEKIVTVLDKGQSGGGINFRSAPRIAPDTYVDHYGMDATFTYLGEAGNFYKVEINGSVGYVHKNLTTVQETTSAAGDEFADDEFYEEDDWEEDW